MTQTVAHLRDRRRQVWEESQALAEEAAQENRYFTAEEAGGWEALQEEIDGLDRKIKDALEAGRRQRETDGLLAQIGPCDYQVHSRLLARRAEVASYCEDQAAEAAKECRAFTAEDEESWALMHGELAHLDERIAGALGVVQRLVQADQAGADIQAREDRPDARRKRLRERRVCVWELWMALAEAAATEARVFEPREVGEYEALREEFDRLDRAVRKGA